MDGCLGWFLLVAEGLPVDAALRELEFFHTQWSNAAVLLAPYSIPFVHVVATCSLSLIDS